MGEWKRVFINGKRIGTMLTMVFLCSLLFLLSLIPQIGPGELELARETAKYTEHLCDRWKDADPEKLPEMQEEEIDRIGNYSFWRNGIRFFEFPYDNDMEADASVSDIPYLLTNRHNGSWLYRIYTSFTENAGSVGEQAAYTAGYSEYLDKIQAQAEEQSKTTIFGNQNSFSMRNLKKTAEEFRHLQDSGVVSEFGNNLSFQKWLSFNTSDFFQLLFIIVIVMSFLEERKKGLWSVIHTAKNGRVRLGIHRVFILLFASVLSTLAFTFLNFGMAELLLGRTDLSRSIQSIEEFRTCTYTITIEQWMYLYFLMKVVSGFTVGVMIFVLLGSITNIQLSLSVLVISLAVEYVLYRFLPVQSALNGLKYVNLFSMVHVSDFFTKYLNINFFGYPVGNKELIYGMTGILAILFTVLSVRMQARRFPEGNKDVFRVLAKKINAVLDRVRTRFTPFTWEVYKHLFFQYGIVILILVVLVSGKLDFRTYRMLTDPEKAYYMYVQDVEGVVNSTTNDYLKRAVESAKQSQQSGTLLSAIGNLYQTANMNHDRTVRYGVSTWIVDDRIYDEYYGSTARNNQRLNAAAALLFLVFLISGITSYENQAGVVPMIRTLRYGRNGVFGRKVLLSVLLTLFSFLMIYMREIIQFASCHPKSLSAAVQNIYQLGEFPFAISFRGYLILLYALRFFSMLSVSFCIMYVSSRCRTVRTAYVLNTAIFCFPALLVVLGVEYFKFASPVVLVSAAEILWNCRNILQLILLYTVIYGIGVIALISYSIRFSGDR